MPIPYWECVAEISQEIGINSSSLWSVFSGYITIELLLIQIHTKYLLGIAYYENPSGIHKIKTWDRLYKIKIDWLIDPNDIWSRLGSFLALVFDNISIIR